MLTLNKIVVESFKTRIINQITHLIIGLEILEAIFLGDVKNMFNGESDVMISFGDVVDCDEGEFGILSGDDLVVRSVKISQCE